MYTLAAALDTFEYWSWTSHTNISSRWCKLTVVNLATFVLVLLNAVVAMWLSNLTPFLTSDRFNNVHQCGLYMSADDSDICSSASQSTAPLDPCPVHKHFSRDDRRSLQQTTVCQLVLGCIWDFGWPQQHRAILPSTEQLYWTQRFWRVIHGTERS